MDEELEKELQELIDDANKEREDEENNSNDNDESGEEEDNSDSKEEDQDNDNEPNDDDDSEEENDNDSDGNDSNDNDDGGDDDDSGDDDKESLDFKPIEVEIGETKIIINSQEELMDLAKKGLSSANVKKSDSENDRFVSQANISKEELTLLADIKSGDVSAIAKLAELSKIDILDIDADKAGEYKPSFEVSVESDVEKVASEIMLDEAHAGVLRNAINTMPQGSDFINVISTDAAKLKAFSNHVRTGLAQQIIPEAIKAHAINGGSFFDHYANIGRTISGQQNNSKSEDSSKESKKSERVVSEKEKKLRSRANDNSKDSGEGNKGLTADDIHNMSDEEFAKIVTSS